MNVFIVLRFSNIVPVCTQKCWIYIMTKSVTDLISQSILKQVSKPKSTSSDDNEPIDIEDHLKANSKRILQQRIEFTVARTQHSTNLSFLQSKYNVLKGKPQIASEDKLFTNLSPPSHENMTIAGPSQQKPGTSQQKSDGLPAPAKVLFPSDKIELSWRKPSKVGCGLSNLGNTCFLNSALQCFTYTAPLVNYLITHDHIKNCRMNGQFCMLCAMQLHLRVAHRNTGQAIRPINFLKNLKMIAKHLHFGRQEDAHEFIRYSIDAMQRASLHGHPNKIDIHVKSTTAIHQIFGGYLRSRVRCLQCKAVSDTYDPFLDLSLEINRQGCVTLQKCLESFTRPESLQGANAYKCGHCKKAVSAMKKFSLHRSPNVLMIQLKRFVNYMGTKNNKDISYPSKLNMTSYMSANSTCKENNNMWYELYAVLVHSGISCQSGHYYSYAKASNGQWYCFNDASVHQVSVNQALNQQAYLLFYIRSAKINKQIQSQANYHNHVREHIGHQITSPQRRTNLDQSTSKSKSPNHAFIGPQLPPHMKNSHSFDNSTSKDKTSMKRSNSESASTNGHLVANKSFTNSLNKSKSLLNGSTPTKSSPQHNGNAPKRIKLETISNGDHSSKLIKKSPMHNGNQHIEINKKTEKLKEKGTESSKLVTKSTHNGMQKSNNDTAKTQKHYSGNSVTTNNFSKLNKHDTVKLNDSTKLANGITKCKSNGEVSRSATHNNSISNKEQKKPTAKIKLVEYSSDSDVESEASQSSTNSSKPVLYNSLASTLKTLRKGVQNPASKTSSIHVNGNNNKNCEDREPILSLLEKEISSSSDNDNNSPRKSCVNNRKNEHSFSNKLKRFKHFDNKFSKRRRSSDAASLLRREKRERLSQSLDEDEPRKSIHSKDTVTMTIKSCVTSNSDSALCSNIASTTHKDSSDSNSRTGILQHLLEQSSNVYGVKVSSWSGNDSVVCSLTAEETKESDSFSKQWNQEFDRGKEKKVKKQIKKEKSKQNLFQRMQNFAAKNN